MTLPETMQALVLIKDGYAGTATGPAIDRLEDWVRLETIPLPKAEGRNVLVRIGLANVNPSDLHYIKGEYGQPRRKGVPAGFEARGTVVAAGNGEGEALIGRRVALSVVPSGSGAWAEYALTDLAAAIPLAEGLRDEDGAALIVNPLTAYAMVHLVKEHGADGFVMTAGASQLAKLMAPLARDEGLHAVAAIRREEQRGQMEALGASHVLNVERSDFPDMLRETMRQVRPRILLDAVADSRSAAIFSAMPAAARWIVYGKLSQEAPTLPDLGQMIFMKKVIEGFWLTDWMGRRSPEARAAAVAAVQARFVSGAWTTDVAAVIPLTEAPARLAGALAGMNRGKVLLRP